MLTMNEQELIGKQVAKKSLRTFKSGLKVNTIKEIVDSPYELEHKCFTFLEDDSLVDINTCKLV